MQQDDIDFIVEQTFKRFYQDHPFMMEIHPYWSDILSVDRINAIMEIAMIGVDRQLRNCAYIEATGAMRWGPTFHQEVLVNTMDDLV